MKKRRHKACPVSKQGCRGDTEVIPDVLYRESPMLLGIMSGYYGLSLSPRERACPGLDPWAGVRGQWEKGQAHVPVHDLP